ncbi:type I polyketide synthase [Streptomyces sp. WMMC1477]|uniref:type I polyketide synthase n=1 Tax=Streptomyces sp. WMMC1477 TaxID=3015155 RepID=UPI003FCDA174
MVNEEKLVDYLKRVTTELHTTRQELREAREKDQEPVAIVAMACRYPGGANSPEALWDVVAQGRDTVTEFPRDRGWDVEGIYDPDPDAEGKSYTRHGAFVHDAANFDADLFGISPREALAMDPQQRMVLETAYEAFERLGLTPRQLKGSSTGVFVGSTFSGYYDPSQKLPAGIEGYSLAGSLTSVVSGRVSYTFGLEGPAVTVDTACSSSLVALHLAVRSVRSGECDLALAGGVSLMASPVGFIQFSRQRGLAVDGRCKAFAAAADGIGWSEGAGVVLVERLSDAVRNGHQVLAVVRGSAVNQDGASNGLSAPNGPSQQRVIRAALANARLSPGEVDAVEAHGTGTTLGDPIEAQALLATYGRDRAEAAPLRLGSIKSNIGHSGPSAGVAGVIKMVMAMRHGRLPQTLHVDEPSPAIDWSAGAVELLTEPMPWKRIGHPRRAGVSGFGISGTNVHVIVEEAPLEESVESVDAAVVGSGGVVPLVVSGRSVGGLVAQAGRLGEWLGSGGGVGVSLVGVGRSLALGRAGLEHRAVVLAGDRGGAVAGLGAVAAGEPAAGVVSGVVVPGRVVMVFPGQGSQWVGMGRELLSSSEVFAGVVAECEEALAPLVEWSLTEVLREGGEEFLGRVDVVQPVLFAVMVGLARLWESVGVVPDVVVGHSQGEIAAAHIAGGLSLEDAVRVVALRSRALVSLAGGGAMAQVALGEEAASELVSAWEGRVGVAAVNGPASTVVSGEVGAVEEVLARCEEEGVWARRIGVDYASHSPQVEEIGAGLEEALAGVRPVSSSSVAFFSTVSGGVVDTATLDAGYWVRNLRRPVRFAPAVEELARSGTGVFIEVSPHPVLTGGITDTLQASGAGGGAEVAAVVETLRRDRGGWTQFLTSAAQAHAFGVELDWDALFPTNGTHRHVDLPTYAFQHQRYWLEPVVTDTFGPSPASVNGDPVDAVFWEAVEGQDLDALAATLELGESGQASLGSVLPALSSWRRKHREESVLESWRYDVAWAPATSRGSGTLSGRWLLVVPDGGVDEALVSACERALAGAGADVVAVRAVAGAGRERLALPLAEAAQGEAAGIVSLLGLDERSDDRAGGVALGLSGTVALLQGLADAGIEEGPLWSLTRGAVATDAGDPAPSPVQAQIWGVGRVAALEMPRLWRGLIDLPHDIGDEDGTWQRLPELLTAPEEDQIALRAGGPVARRMVRAPLGRAVPARHWQPRDTLMIIGATGVLGAQLARWAVREGAENLLLVSRRGIEAPGAEDLKAELDAQGVRTTFAACDITDRQAMAELVEGARAAMPPIRTVVHSVTQAGLDPLADITLDQLHDTAKVVGADVLDELFDDDSLDAFVLFSSIAAFWGSGDHAAYAAANAHLDALAARRRGRGLPATSVAWGVWNAFNESDDTKTAVRSVLYDRANRQGLPLLDAGTALSGLRQVLDHDETFVAISAIDWDRFAPLFTSARPSWFLADLPDARAALAAEDEQAQRAAAEEDEEAHTLRSQLSASSREERSRFVLDLVRAQVAVVLGHATAEAVESGRAFRDMGFDSLTGVDLRNRLTAETGLQLPATLVFDYPTPRGLADFLTQELTGGAAPADEVRSTAAATADEPIAIVAMSCRYPGGAESPDELWELIASGTDAISGFPTDRGWDLERRVAQEGDAERKQGTSYVRDGGFLRGMADFDPALFGISPREALTMDPQQRLVLESVWELFERAGIDPRSVKGSQTGTFIGCSWSEYCSGERNRTQEGIEGYLVTGGTPSVISGRAAYTFGLEGPAISVDTACSSSLVALHLAAQGLRNGECSMAVAGGVAVQIEIGAFVSFSSQGALAADGRCKAFSADADGMGLSEGVGLVLLERLSDARRNGHEVLAVIRGSAMNQDGASNGLSAPNGPSQQRVTRQALANARLDPADVDAVEAHGTGTSLGDPIEAQALLATYGQGRPEGRPLWLGSVKSNIGHTAAAAGVAGVIKMVMAMRHGLLPRTLHAEKPSEHIDWSSGAVELLTEARPWPELDRPRRVGVSSFGISGTNAHLILEQAPPEDADSAPEPAAGDATGAALQDTRGASADGAGDTDVPPGPVAACGVVPLVLSGKSAGALAGQAARLRDFLGRQATAETAGGNEGGREPLADVGWSAATTRAALEHRGVVLARSSQEARARLEKLAAGQAAPGVVTGLAASGGDRRVIMVFPGQGSQWLGMARELLDTSEVFAEALSACAEALAPHVDWSLTEVLRHGGAEEMERVDVVQPVLFAVMVALARLWESAGVHPDAVVGHSQGEIAAAHVAGGLSLADAARIVALRSRTLVELSGLGAMASVALGRDRTEALIAPWRDQLSVAAVNSPQSTLVSGGREAVAEFTALCEKEGVWARRVPVDYASHSVHVERVHDRLLTELADLEPRTGNTAFWSTVTGDAVDTATLDAGYWYRNLRETVSFAPVVTALAGQGDALFIEVAPHAVLTAALQDCVEAAGSRGALRGAAAVVSTLRRDDGGPERFLTSLAEAWANDAPVDWAAVFAGTSPRRTPLPTYAFQHQRYWLDGAPPAGDGRVTGAGLTAADHPLLSARLHLAGGDECLLTGQLSLAAQPWLADHTVAGAAVVPASALLELAVRAGDESGCGLVEQLTLQAPLVLPPRGALDLQVRVAAPDADGRRALDVHSRGPHTSGNDTGHEPGAGGCWVRHATGTLCPAAPPTAPPAAQDPWPPRDAEPVALASFYADSADRAHTLGPAFQALRAVWRHGADVLAEVELPEEWQRDADRFGIHPVLLDAAHQAASAAAGDASGPGRPVWPAAYGGARLEATGATRLRVRITPAGPGHPEDAVRLELSDAEGLAVAEVAALTTRPVDADQIVASLTTTGELPLVPRWIPLDGAAGALAGEAGAPGTPRPAGAARWTVLGTGPTAEAVHEAIAVADGVTADRYDDPAAWTRATADTETQDRGTDAASDVVVWVCPPAADPEDAGAVRAALTDVLGTAQTWLADARWQDRRLVALTQHAVTTGDTDPLTDPAQAAALGLLRAVQAEGGDRLLLADADGQAATYAALPALVAAAHEAGETQLALRGGKGLVPRLAHLDPPAGRSRPAEHGTVLVTGGTGRMGAHVARHLVTAHGVRHLLLLGRRGPAAPGAAELRAELERGGAQVEIVACDAADPQDLARALETVPADRPLTGVVHAAGAPDEVMVASLTPDRLAAALRSKVDVALNLHRATQDAPLAMFVLFSHVSAVLGGPAQGNTAVANAYLDALAQRRTAAGLPGLSLAWGPWEREDALERADRARMARGGLVPLPAAHGLQLLDGALTAGRALQVPVRIDTARLRAEADSGLLPPPWRALVGGPNRRSVRSADAEEPGAALRQRLAALPARRQLEALVDLVCGHAAVALGHESADQVEPGQAFQDIGFDSLIAVDLRNRLVAATALRLPATLTFDFPTPGDLAVHLRELLAPDSAPGETGDGEEPGEARIRQAIAAVPVEQLRQAGVLGTLLRLAGLAEEEDARREAPVEEMSVDDLVQAALDDNQS